MSSKKPVPPPSSIVTRGYNGPVTNGANGAAPESPVAAQRPTSPPPPKKKGS